MGIVVAQRNYLTITMYVCVALYVLYIVLYTDILQYIHNQLITAGIFVRSIIAVLLPIAEEPPLDAVAIPTGQVVLLADGLVCEEERLHLLLFGLAIAVLHSSLPVTRLLLDVEGQTSWTANGL